MTKFLIYNDLHNPVSIYVPVLASTHNRAIPR